jgi:phage terminase small subunit
MGRNGQPIDILTANGRKHLTKAEIENRKNFDIKLGTKDLKKLKPPAFVKNDLVAFSYWKQMLKEYKEAASNGTELITSSDVGMLALYCKTYADYERLLKSYQTIDKIAYDTEALDQYIEDSEDFNYRVKLQLRGMVAVDGLLRIETAINKKMDMLIKMQDRLFLNPLAKVKNVPTQKKNDKPASKFAKFGAGKSG